MKSEATDRLIERKKDWTRTEIQKAAKKVFFRRGYSNSSMDEIARLAKLSKGSIYVYFRNKDDLYVSLMLPLLEQLGKRLSLFKKELTGTGFKNCNEILEGLLSVFYEAYKSCPDEFQIIQLFQQGGLISDLSEETRERLNAAGRKNNETLREIIRKTIDLGLFRKVHPIQLSDLLWGIFIGLVQFETSKLRITKRDHLVSTLRFSFSLLNKGLCPLI